MNAANDARKSRYDILDIAKFVLSIFVIAIHTNLFPFFLYPWLRLAIPLFFIISSYLLHVKILQNPNQKKQIISKYIKRQLIYYCFWLIVLLPITMVRYMGWYNNGLVRGLWKTISSFFFANTFEASWFISASIIGTLIVEKAVKVTDKKGILLILFSLVYLVCCFSSSYTFIFANYGAISDFGVGYFELFSSPALSFPVSLLYIYIGRLIADDIRHGAKRSMVKTICLPISFILLFVEWKIVGTITGVYNFDCYLFLPLCAYLIMGQLLLANIRTKYGILLRKMSIIFYPLHASLALVLKLTIGKNMPIDERRGIILFIITLSICAMISLLILRLEKNKRLQFLKYSH